MRDYVHRYCFIDDCVKLILFNKTSCKNCFYSHWNDFCLIPLTKCKRNLKEWSVILTSFHDMNQKILQKKKKKKKGYFAKFHLIQTFYLQAMHDYVHWYCTIDDCVKLILFNKTSCKNCFYSHWNDFCLIPLTKCKRNLKEWSVILTSFHDMNQKILQKKRKKKGYFAKFHLIQTFYLQAMHDYVHWYCTIDDCVKLILVNKTLCEYCIYFTLNDFCLIPLMKCAS